MTKRNKLQKFAEILSFDHVVENYDPTNPMLVGKDGETVELKGRWAAEMFQNDHPLILELCCGRGEYCIALAQAFPENNYLGVDIKGARIWDGAIKSQEQNLSNVAFFRTRIEQTPLFFEKDEVDQIWITFPDPFLKERKENRRLTSPMFIDRYRSFLKPAGIVHLKTDSEELYEYSMESLGADPKVNILYENADIYSQALDYPELNFKTFYEKAHLKANKKIKYIRFTID